MNILGGRGVMRRIKLWGVALVAGLLIETGVAWTADTAETRDVLSRLHDLNQKQIAVGQLAQKRARSDDAKTLASTIIDSHTAVDEMVLALAREQHIELDALTAAAKSGDAALAELAFDPSFDTRFARTVLDENARAVTAATAAHQASHDATLRKLLEDVLPILRNDRDMAQKMLNATPRALL
jgi:predicted outer membrane protein